MVRTDVRLTPNLSRQAAWQREKGWELEEEDLLAWRESLPKEMRATSKQRLINDFKAALNTTCAANRKSLPPTLSSAIKFGLRAIRSNDEDE